MIMRKPAATADGFFPKRIGRRKKRRMTTGKTRAAMAGADRTAPGTAGMPEAAGRAGTAMGGAVRMTGTAMTGVVRAARTAAAGADKIVEITAGTRRTARILTVRTPMARILMDRISVEMCRGTETSPRSSRKQILLPLWLLCREFCLCF